jgi:hypothetical protein
MSAVNAGQIDSLAISGTAQLSGELGINLVNGFLPDPDRPDVFSVISYASHTGEFSPNYELVGTDRLLAYSCGATTVTLTAYWLP